MDPLTIALLFGGGALASGLGSWIQSKQGYQDSTQDWINQFNNGKRDLNWQNSERLTNALWGGGNLDPQTYLQKATGFTNNASDIYSQLLSGLNGGGKYTSKGMQGSFNDLLPGITQNAGTVANAATSRAGDSMTALAQRESARALNQMQAGLSAGGLFGAAAGPVAASMAYGAQEPLMAAQNNINQLYANAYGQAYNPMATFAMSNIQQEPQNLANMGQLYAGLASQQYGAASPLLSLLGQQSQQAYLAPDLKQKTSLLGSLLQGFGGTASQLGSYQLGQGWNGNGFGSTPKTPDYSSLWGYDSLNGNNYAQNYQNPWAVGYRNR